MADVSTLFEARKRSSFVIPTGSNNHMQRSAAGQSHMLTSMQHAAPADMERYAQEPVSLVIDHRS
jgi:hypothetical protein